MAFMKPVWNIVFQKEKKSLSLKLFLFCQHSSQMLRLRAVFTTTLFFVRIANEKNICLFFQGQGTCALWQDIKIDGEHKRSAPLKDLEAPKCRWAFAFELHPSAFSAT